MRAAIAVMLVGLVRPAGLAQAPIPRFTDVTAASGINVTGLGNSSAWIDVDGDGDLDLLGTNSSIPTAKTWLYRNDGAGHFTDVTQAAGLGSASIRSAAWGDYDNDGHPDLAATGYASGGRTQLFHNDGDGTFTEVGRAAGMKTAGIPWRVAWADYDRDGSLDLYQANLGADYLYHSNGDGTFTELAAGAGVSNAQSTNDGAWGDFDRDGWPDLFAADDGGDHLYRNDHDGTFSDVTQQAGVSDGDESVSACWGDDNADGRPDLYVVDIGANRNHLYRNAGDGTFTDVTQQTGVGDVGDGRTCDWVDANADGRLDLFTANHVHLSRLYQQAPGGTFRDVAPAAGIASPFDVFNGAWGDMDGDGDLDAFVVGHDGNVLYRNDGPAGGYLLLDLVGSTSNRSAIGAIALLSGSGVRADRTVEGSGGAYGQDSLTVEFGLGQAAGPFTVRVVWPSGTVQTLTGLTANTHLQVVEPPG